MSIVFMSTSPVPHHFQPLFPEAGLELDAFWLDLFFLLLNDAEAGAAELLDSGIIDRSSDAVAVCGADGEASVASAAVGTGISASLL